MKGVAVPAIAVLVFVFVFDFVVHGVLLADAYKETAHLWRAPEEQKMLFMMVSQMLFSAFFVLLYRSLGENSRGGVYFGAIFGLIMAALQIGKFSYLPVPFMLIACWAVAEFLKGLASGTIVGKLSHAKRLE